jgi:hypothetical protein
LAQYGWPGNFTVAEANDADGDGLTAWQEYLAGTDPTNAASVLGITGLQAGPDPTRMLISWLSASNKLYSVLKSTNLITGWMVATNLPAHPPMNVYTDTVNWVENLFYKVQLETP